MEIFFDCRGVVRFDCVNQRFGLGCVLAAEGEVEGGVGEAGFFVR